MTRRLMLLLGAIGVVGCLLLLAVPSLVEEVGKFVSGGRTGILVAGGSGGECAPPPRTFKEEDLIGVWTAGNERRMDTLVVYEGGLYQQRIETDSPPFSYESEPLSWWVEYREGELPLLHLEGMRLCVYALSPDCQSPPPSLDQWYDFCSSTILEARGEGLLIIAGVPPEFEQPIHGIELLPLTKDPDTGGWPYRLEGSLK